MNDIAMLEESGGKRQSGDEPEDTEETEDK